HQHEHLAVQRLCDRVLDRTGFRADYFARVQPNRWLRAESGMMRALARLVRATPFHPQWLIRGERVGFARLSGRASGRVLDIGCGDRWAESQLPEGCTYIGLDSLEMGRDRYGSRPTLFADASSLPFAPGAMDTVLMMEVLEHLSDPECVLSEVNSC